MRAAPLARGSGSRSGIETGASGGVRKRYSHLGFPARNARLAVPGLLFAPIFLAILISQARLPIS